MTLLMLKNGRLDSVWIDSLSSKKDLIKEVDNWLIRIFSQRKNNTVHPPPIGGVREELPLFSDVYGRQPPAQPTLGRTLTQRCTRAHIETAIIRPRRRPQLAERFRPSVSHPGSPCHATTVTFIGLPQRGSTLAFKFPVGCPRPAVASIWNHDQSIITIFCGIAQYTTEYHLVK